MLLTFTVSGISEILSKTQIASHTFLLGTPFCPGVVAGLCNLSTI